MFRRYIKYDWISNIVENGGSVTVRCTTLKEFNYYRIYFSQSKGWRVRVNSKTLHIKITQK